MTKTTFATRADHDQAMATWHLVDASQYVLGKMATRIAAILMGKHKPIYTPNVNVGEGVVVINAGLVKLTGSKGERRLYHFYSGWPGGLKECSLQEMLEKKPEELVKLVVRRMLPKTRLAKTMLKRLKVYAGTTHPHTAQKPKELKLDTKAAGLEEDHDARK